MITMVAVNPLAVKGASIFDRYRFSIRSIYVIADLRRGNCAIALCVLRLQTYAEDVDRFRKIEPCICAEEKR